MMREDKPGFWEGVGSILLAFVLVWGLILLYGAVAP